MRRLSAALIAMVAAVAVTQTVLAAPPAYNWTGFYVGVNAGGSFGRNPTTESNATFGTLIGSFTLLPDGFAGGGQIGYTYQFDRNWIVGVEGDFQGMSQSASNCSGLGCTVAGGAYFTADQKLLWFATARARFGYTNADWLCTSPAAARGEKFTTIFAFSHPLTRGLTQISTCTDGQPAAALRNSWAADGRRSSNICIWTLAASPTADLILSAGLISR